MNGSFSQSLRRRLGRSLISQSEHDTLQHRSWLVDELYRQKLDVRRSGTTRQFSIAHTADHDTVTRTRPLPKATSGRRFHSEVNVESLEDLQPELFIAPLHALPLTRREALRFKAETRPTDTSNDAPVVEISADIHTERTSLPHGHQSSRGDQPAVVTFSEQIKHPLQAEWENLYYHGVNAAYRDIAHLFPEFEKSTSQTLNEQSISEPTLDISSLKKEEQEAFVEKEQKQSTSFAPGSESERLRRIEQAQRISDQREKFAVLLGLPTFAQYIEAKQTIKEQSRDPSQPSKRQLKRETRFALKKEKKQSWKVQNTASDRNVADAPAKTNCHSPAKFVSSMTQQSTQAASSKSIPIGGAEHRPLVVGLTKPQSTRSVSTMASSSDVAALNKEIAENVKENTTEAAPAEETTSAPSSSKPKKEKAPKQPKPQKAAAPTAPTTPALIDLRVGHILRAIAHPNADSLYVSTIAMGDAEGTEHTQVDEQTGKVVRTVCSGLNGLVPLEEMQDRKIIVVANLKPVNMRSIKSAAMVLAASPKQEEGADPHAPDRVVELVQPPEGSEAGDKVYFEGWSYGEGKGPEKVLNPKKKQWEAIQPGFYTSEDLVVAFDAGQCDEVEGSEKGNLVVEGKGVCTVKTLKGAVVR